MLPHLTVTHAPEHQVPEGSPLVFAVCEWDRSIVRLGCAALLIVTWLRGVGVADPQAGEAPSHDQNAAVRAPAKSPWIDRAPAEVLTTKSIDEPKRDYRLVSALGLAGVYAGFSAWAYLA